MVEGQDTSRKDAAMNLLKQKMLDLEQQVMKEKIDTLAFRLEEDKELNVRISNFSIIQVTHTHTLTHFNPQIGGSIVKYKWFLQI